MLKPWTKCWQRPWSRRAAPRVPMAAENAGRPLRNPARRANRMPKVLLAEDDQTMVSLLKTLLKMDGYEVAALDADDDVAAAVRRVRPDVLVMDVMLGDQNGLDVLDALRGGH